MEEKSSSAKVRLATKDELGPMREFLAGYLPDSSGIYNCIGALITTPNDLARVYFMVGPDGNYEAILRIQEGKCTDEKGKVKKGWHSAHWSLDDHHWIEMFHHIDCIDWKEDSLYTFGSTYSPSEIIQSHFIERGLSFEKHRMDRYVMDIPTALSAEMKCPQEVYVKSLERCHAPIVFEYWPFNNATVVDLIADDIDQMPSAGVFLKDGDRLVSWLMEFPPNGMSRLHTLDEYRRRGYAGLAVTYMSKRMAQCGRLPFAHVVVGNESSSKMFQKLGFRFAGGVHVWDVFAKP